MRISDWSSDVCSSDLLVQPESASALAAACQRYCDSPAFAKSMADRARTDACGRFGEDAHARQIMAIYDRRLSRNPASAVAHRQLTRGGATNGRAGWTPSSTSEARRVGNECVSRCRSRGSTANYKKKEQ